VSRAPEPTADAISVMRGSAAETTITANDPNSTSHSYAITTPPLTGAAAVNSEGVVRVCADPGVAGTDNVTVTVTDTTATTRTAAITIPITIEDTASPAASCDVNAFGDTGSGGGCCDSGGGAPGTAIPLGIALALLLNRRRAR
jgi:hypothetical protein